MKNSIIEEPGNTISENLSLEYLVRMPQAKSTKNKAIILLHGVGSNEADLFSFADQLPADFFVFAARGKYTLSANRYAWYSVDFSTGKPVYNTEQEISSRKTIALFIAQLKRKYSLDEIYLGGFSQGAIMSYSIGLCNQAEVQGIFALSGRILDEIRPSVNKDDHLQKLKVFVAHGLQDNTLSIQYARNAKEYLESLGVQLNYHEYPIGHFINNEELRDLNEWLK